MLHNLWNYLARPRGPFFDHKERHDYLLSQEIMKSQIHCLTHL